MASRKESGHVPALTPDSSSLPKYAVIEPKAEKMFWSMCDYIWDSRFEHV